jgi:hypothetical protein
MNNSEKLIMLLIAFAGAGGLVGLITFLVNATDNGGIFYGKWLTKTKAPHQCGHPSWFTGEAGDRWQCRKCKTIWQHAGHSWKAEK